MATDDDPESDDKKMPLLDHLIELRSRLLWSVIALFAAFILCFIFAKHLYAFLVQPLADILAEKGLDRRMIYTALTEVFFTYVKVAFFFGAVFACGLKRRYYYGSTRKASGEVVSGISHAPAAGEPKIEVAPRAVAEGERFNRAISGQSVHAPQPTSAARSAPPRASHAPRSS